MTLRKGYRTVKGTIIFRMKLPFVITRNGFCAQTKPTFRYEERLLSVKHPFRRMRSDLFLLLCLLRIARNDLCLFKLFTPQNEERPLSPEKGYSALRRTTFVRRQNSLVAARNGFCVCTKATLP
jgi:hypothetical protein